MFTKNEALKLQASSAFARTLAENEAYLRSIYASGTKVIPGETKTWIKHGGNPGGMAAEISARGWKVGGQVEHSLLVYL
jgi:hypothetical protein